MDDRNKLHRFDNMVLLRECKLFAGLAPSQLQRVVMLAKEKSFNRGDVVLESALPVTTLIIVKDGSCAYGEKLYVEGDVVLDYTLFVHSFMLDEKVIAEEDSIYLMIEQRDLYDLLMNNPETSVKLVERYAEQLLNLKHGIE